MRQALNDRLPDGIRVGYGTVYLHTDRGIAALERLAASDRWDRWHALGVGVLSVLMAAATALVGAAAVAAIQNPTPSAATEPQNMVAVPGVNDLMPVAAAGWILGALLLATIVHEGGHALGALREGIGVDELGVVLLAGVVPIAAYVLPDEDQLEASNLASRMRVLSAGVLNNAALAVVGIGLAVALPTVDLIAAYDVYFGWLDGGSPPTNADVGALGALSNAVWWTVFINANLAFVNALPVKALDGGRVFAGVVETVSLPRVDERAVAWSATLLVLGAFVTTVVAPEVLA